VELVGGILLILGLATRWVGLVLALEMIVTGFWPCSSGQVGES